MSKIDPFPTPQRRGCGGTIRWAVGDPDGLRSQSWNIVGSSTDDDVYIGPRMQMGAIKLSLHRSGRWRMAWTEEYAESIGMPEDEDRVLGRWDPPDEVRPGWRHAVTVLVMPDSLAPHRPEKRLGRVAFFPPPNPDNVLWFRVLLGAPNCELAVTGAVEVGTLQLPSGGMIGVCVRPGPMSPESAAKIRDVRAQMLRVITGVRARRNRAFAWGRLDDGAVWLLDPGVVEPEGAEPDGAGQMRAPGRLTYVRRGGPGRLTADRHPW